MRDSYTALYYGLSARRGEYGKIMLTHLKDIYSETDNKKKFFSGLFGGKSAALERLKPRFGDLIFFCAEADESQEPVKMVRPTKIELQLFDVNYKGIFSKFYKNFGDASSKEEEFIARRLFRRFPEEEFWQDMDLGFQLNSLGFFMSREQYNKLITQYHKFLRKNVYIPTTPKEVQLEDTSVAEALKLDFSKIKKPLIKRFET